MKKNTWAKIQIISVFRNHLFILISLLGILAITSILTAQSNSIPFHISANLFDSSQPGTLGLKPAPETETFTIFHPSDTTDKYSNGVVLISFKGHLYAQWQSSSKDEDASDTWVAYSRSPDGIHWSEPMVLAPRQEKGIYTSGGWWTFGDTLVAYINVWSEWNNKSKGGFTQYRTSTDGIHWSQFKSLLNRDELPVAGIFEQDPHALPHGRIISAVHEQPGLIVYPYFTDDPRGITGWTRGVMDHLPFEGFVSRELEPSWFYTSDGSIVMLFRDQASSFRKLAAISRDRGETWSTPVVTEMPDSRAKQSAGNLPDGTAYQVNCPSGSKTRFPLVIILSQDGKLFDKAYLLRSGGADLQPKRFEGKYKRIGYSYPKSVIWKDYLYIAYATNKEDVELTRVPLHSLRYSNESHGEPVEP